MNNVCDIYFLLLILTVSWSKAQDGTEVEPEKSMTPDHIRLNYALAWSDEFEGLNVNVFKWNYRAEGTTIFRSVQGSILSGWNGPMTSMYFM